LDYYYIKRKNEIVQLDVQTILDNPSLYPFATTFRANNDLPGIPNSGSLAGVVAPYINANTTTTDGLDLDAKYRFPTSGYGTWTVEGAWTHIFKFERTFASGEKFDYAGSHGPTALSSAAGMPKDRAIGSVGWDYGPWAAT